MQETLDWFLIRNILWRRDRLPTPVFLGFPDGSAGEESTCNAGDIVTIPGLGRSTGEGIGYPLQYSWASLMAQLGMNLPATWEWSEEVAQSCPTLCDPIDYTVRGVLQARILEWIAFPFSRGSSQPKDRTQVSCIEGRFFTSWATREAPEYWSG